MWLRLTRSGISQSRELILVRGGVSFKEAQRRCGPSYDLGLWRRMFTFSLACVVMAAARQRHLVRSLVND